MKPTVTTHAPPLLPFTDLVLIGSRVHSSRVLRPPGPDPCLAEQAELCAAAVRAGRQWDRRVDGRMLYHVVPGPVDLVPCAALPWFVRTLLPDGRPHTQHVFIPQGTKPELQAVVSGGSLEQSPAVASRVRGIPSHMRRWSSVTARLLATTGPRETRQDSAEVVTYMAAAVLQPGTEAHPRYALHAAFARTLPEREGSHFPGRETQRPKTMTPCVSSSASTISHSQTPPSQGGPGIRQRARRSVDGPGCPSHWRS